MNLVDMFNTLLYGDTLSNANGDRLNIVDGKLILRLFGSKDRLVLDRSGNCDVTTLSYLIQFLSNRTIQLHPSDLPSVSFLKIGKIDD